MKQFNHVKGFSLLEVLVAVTVFSLIVAAAAGTFASIQQSWRKQRNTIDMVQNARWAMEFMANEVRQSTTTATPAWARVATPGGGQRIRFGIDTNGDNSPDTPRVWYWRGNSATDTTGLGDQTFLYRGRGPGIAGAYGSRQQLANFIVDNPSGNDIFNEDDGIVTIELTVRPNPAQPPTSPGNRDYTLRTQVRVRN